MWLDLEMLDKEIFPLVHATTNAAGEDDYFEAIRICGTDSATPVREETFSPQRAFHGVSALSFLST